MSVKHMLLAGVITMLLPSIEVKMNPAFATEFNNSEAVEESFRAFQSPEIFQYLYEKNTNALNDNKTENFIYLSVIIEAFDAPDVWYRIGQENEAILDPLLAPSMRGIAMTDRAVIQMQMNAVGNSVWSMLKGLADERQRQQSNNIFDPMGEMAAVNKGAMQGMNDLVAIKANASMDARRLMLVARDDPKSFMKIYEGIRQFIYTY